MVAKLIFGIVLPVFGLGYSEFSLSDTCSLDSLDGQGVYECFKKKVKTPIWLSMKRMGN